MGRKSRRPQFAPRCDGLEPRMMLAADTGSATQIATLGTPEPAVAPPQLVVAVIDSGVDFVASDPIHASSTSPYVDMADAYNAVDGSTGQASVPDLTANKQGTRDFNAVLRGINDAVALGGSTNVLVVPIKTSDNRLGDSPFYATVGAIYHAADLGVGVIDLNLAANQATLTISQYVQLNQAIQYARSKNTVVVVPSGDGFGASTAGVNLDDPTTLRLQDPAVFHTSNMLVVGSTDASGNLRSSSNWGSTHVDLGAMTSDSDPSTPVATGYVAGVAASLMAARTDWTAINVVNRIKATVQASTSLAGRTTTGGNLSLAQAFQGFATARASNSPNDDYEGDLKADFAIYGNIPAVGGYGFAVTSSTQGFNPYLPTLINNAGYSIGGKGTIPVPGNYYVNGISQPAIYGPELDASGKPDGNYDFAILSPNGFGQYSVTTFAQGVGGPGDVPVVGDFDGDGRQDLAVYGKHNGQYNFWVLTASSNFSPYQMVVMNNNGYSFGGPGSVPVVGDFFGNGKTDLAVYGPEYGSNGQPNGKYDFAALDAGSKNASGLYTRSLVVQGFGQAGDIPIVGDYDGDGTSDLAVYGNHNGQYNFQVLASSTGFSASKALTLNNNGYSFGGPGAVPISGDFFGDGGTDLSVFGPEYLSNGQADGKYAFASLDLKSKTSKGVITRSLVIKGFGGPTTIPASAPPAVKTFEAIQG